ncbi:MAG TPA: PAS domain S-box protein [Planctomycetota bacterium]|nr:PAS domain S-box protein [Planctomycetota bacterium]
MQTNESEGKDAPAVSLGPVRASAQAPGPEIGIDLPVQVVLDSLRDPALALLDAQGIVRSWGAAGERMLGWTAAQVVGRHVSELGQPQDRAEVERNLQRAASEGWAEHEGWLQRADGKLLWSELSLAHLRAPGGELIGFARLMRDATAARRATLQVAEGAARMKAVLDAVIDGILVIDGSGAILSVNPAVQRIFGYPMGELVGRNVKLLMPDPYRREHDGYLEHYRRTGERRIIGIGREVIGRRSDGSTFPIDLSVSEVELGERRLFTGIVRDITARKRDEEAVRESEARLRAVVETAVDGILTIDEQGMVGTMNPAAERMFGYAAAEVVGRNISLLMPSPYREEHDGYLDHYRQTGERRIIGIGREVQGRRKDGSIFPLELAVSETVLGERRFFTGIVRDITERKRDEESLARQSQELERSNAELQQFAYAASHDLQEPLRMITSYVQLLERRYGKRLGSEGEHFVGYVVEGARRMGQLIDDLLRYSRVEAGAEPAQEVEAGDVLMSVLGLLAPTIREAGAEVRFADLPRLRASRVHLEQLFQNLIGNAIKFRGPDPPRIEVSACRSGAMWQIAVADNGIGIAPEYFDKVFAIFQRLHTREQYPGTGVGLAICKKIVERYGGRIWVESEPGRGSTFKFELP